MTGVEIKREFQPGRYFQVTNHYITRTDHPCYGSRLIEVRGSNSNSVQWETLEGMNRGKEEKVEWPKASQLEVWPDGTIAFYGGGCGQQPDELFLTFEEVPHAA